MTHVSVWRDQWHSPERMSLLPQSIPQKSLVSAKCCLDFSPVFAYYSTHKDVFILTAITPDLGPGRQSGNCGQQATQHPVHTYR